MLPRVIAKLRNFSDHPHVERVFAKCQEDDQHLAGDILGYLGPFILDWSDDDFQVSHSFERRLFCALEGCCDVCAQLLVVCISLELDEMLLGDFQGVNHATDMCGQVCVVAGKQAMLRPLEKIVDSVLVVNQSQLELV